MHGIKKFMFVAPTFGTFLGVNPYRTKGYSSALQHSVTGVTLVSKTESRSAYSSAGGKTGTATIHYDLIHIGNPSYVYSNLDSFKEYSFNYRIDIDLMLGKIPYKNGFLSLFMISRN